MFKLPSTVTVRQVLPFVFCSSTSSLNVRRVSSQGVHASATPYGQGPWRATKNDLGRNNNDLPMYRSAQRRLMPKTAYHK